MLRAMDSAVAGLRAHQNKMDVVGHNIANVNTYGYKAQQYTFKEAMYQTSTASTGNNGNAGGVNAAQYGYGTLMGTIGMDMTASTPTYVGGFNASINGQGFFITSTSADNILEIDADTNITNVSYDYTRVGQFTVDSAGYVVDGNGHYVYGFQINSEEVDPGLAAKDPNATEAENIYTGYVDSTKLVPLRAPDNSSKSGDYSFEYADGTVALKLGSVQIDQNGKISASVNVEKTITDANGKQTTTEVTETIYLGTVAIATFQNPNGLTKMGENYYNASSGDNTGQSAATIPGEGTTPTLMTGYIEASNVDLAKEFADMITTHRGFQANSKMITVSDEMLSDLVAMKR